MYKYIVKLNLCLLNRHQLVRIYLHQVLSFTVVNMVLFKTSEVVFPSFHSQIWYAGYSTTVFWVVSCGYWWLFKSNMLCPSNLDL